MVESNHDDILHTQESSTNNASEGIVAYSSVMNLKHLDSVLTEGADSGYSQSIIHFLQKPYPLVTTTVTTATTGTFASYNIFGDVLNQTVYTNKLSGFFAFRATTIIRIQTNANRFQAGRLIFHFLPQDSVTGMYNGSDRNDNLITITQQPRVEIDIGNQTEAIIEIPYISPQSHLNLVGGFGNVGTLYASIYSPLAVGTGGSTDFDYTIWVSFKDIEVLTPTTGSVVFGTQMDDDSSKTSTTAHLAGIGKKIQSETGNDLGKIIQNNTKLPSGSSKGGNKEKEEAGKNSWAKSTGAIAATAGMLSTIPALTPFALPVAGLAAVASGVCSIFGWSKPAIGSRNLTQVRFGSTPYMANSDGVDTAVVLANSYENAIQLLPGFAGNDMDEMSINYLVSRPAYFTSFSWSSGTAAGTGLLSVSMTPQTFKSRTTSSNATHIFTYEYHTPISYISKYFRYYRGNIRLTFKFVKTEFHSGRCVLSFAPTGSVISSLADTTYLFREVVDLRHGTEFSYVIPYVSTIPYRPTVDGTVSGVVSSYGTVDVRILNELVSPGSVNSTIQCLVEVSAEPGFELCAPCYPSTDNFVTGDQFEPFKTQMDTVPEVIGEVYKPIGSSRATKTDTVLPSFACMGERINSIKQLLTRIQPLRLGTGGLSGSATTNVVDPFIPGGVSMPVSGTGNLVTPPIYGDYLSHFSGLYAYARGSVRFAKTKWSTAADRTQTTLGFRRGTSNTQNVSTSTIADTIGPSNNLVAFHNSDQNNCFTEVRVPPYMPVNCRLNRYDFGEATTRPPIDVYRSPVLLQYVQSDTAGTSTGWWRGVADDFQFGYFVGVPKIFIRSTTI
jgi:hypothetical protein